MAVVLSSKKRSVFLRCGWAAITAVVVIVVALVSWRWRAERQARFEARQIVNNFRQLLLGFHNYNDTWNTLPRPCRVDSSGKTLSSWRFFDMTYHGKPAHGVASELGFDTPENQYWYERPNDIYCYAAENSPEALFTGVLAITGPGTAFDAAEPHSLQDLSPGTILIVECRYSGLHWMECGDLDIRTMPSTINALGIRGISAHTSLGVVVGFADGRAWLLRSDVPFDILSRFFTVAGAGENSREELLGKYRVPPL